MKPTSETCGASLRLSREVATIVLDRPAKRNALGLSAWQAIPQLIQQAEADANVALIVVRGAGAHFSAGNDIVELSTFPGRPKVAEEFGKAMAIGIRSVEAAKKTVVMAIEGMCYGAAVALSLAGDLRIASGDSTFAITPAKLGALYLKSDLTRLIAAIGVGPSKLLVYTAQPIDAKRALAIGLVDELIDAHDFEEQLSSLIQSILIGSPFTIGKTKEMLGELVITEEKTANDSIASFVEATQSEDFQQGITAFLDRGPPNFRRRRI